MVFIRVVGFILAVSFALQSVSAVHGVHHQERRILEGKSVKETQENDVSLKKWAEVLSADAFSAFEDAGLNDDKALRDTGYIFRDTVLALGGGKDPLEVFIEFRGREPSPEPLLRHNGLLQATA